MRRLLHFLNRTDGTLHHRALRSGIWVTVSSVGVTIVTSLRSVVLARLLTPEIFGQMAIGLMAVRLIDIFTETGFAPALIHRQESFEEARDTAFTLMVLRGIGLAGFSVLIAPWVADFYDQPLLRSVIAVVGLSFLITGCQNTNTIALQKELNFRRLTYIDQTGATLSFVVSVGLAYWLRSVWALAYAQVAGAAITSALSFLFVPARVKFRFDPAVARELMRYGRYITGLAIVVFLSFELDNALIGKVLGMEQLGYYVAAYSLANIPSTYMSKVVARVLFPMFSKLQKDLPALRAEYARGIRLITALAVPISIVLVVLAPQVVAVLYTPKWAAAVVPLQVLAVFGCFRALWMLNGYLYNAVGRPHVDFYVNLARLVVMLALLYPLTAAYGLLGASVAVTAPMVAQFVLGVHLSRRLLHAPLALALRPLLVAAGHGAVLGAGLAGLTILVRVDSIAGLALAGALTCVVYAALNARLLRTLVEQIMRPGGMVARQEAAR